MIFTVFYDLDGCQAYLLGHGSVLIKLCIFSKLKLVSLQCSLLHYVDTATQASLFQCLEQMCPWVVVWGSYECHQSRNLVFQTSGWVVSSLSEVTWKHLLWYISILYNTLFLILLFCKVHGKYD